MKYPNLNEFEKPNVVTTSVDFIFSWARSRSIFPFTYGLACCAIEMLSSGFARFDVARYGMEVFRAHAAPVRPDDRRRHRQREDGAGPASGSTTRWPSPSGSSRWAPARPAAGPFYDGYNVVNGVDKIVPVDVYIPGCPPRPEALFQGLLELQKKIEKMRIVPPPGEIVQHRLTGDWPACFPRSDPPS